METEILDISFDSLTITHQADAVSKAVFTLPRRFDAPDYMLDGTFSEISNQNVVTIKYKGIQLFTGKVTEINAISSTDTIQVSCTGYQQFAAGVSKLTIPISGLNDKRYSYDAILSDVNIQQGALIQNIEQNPIAGGLLPVGYTVAKPSLAPADLYNGVKIWLGMQKREYTTKYTGTVEWDSNGQVHLLNQYGSAQDAVYDPSDYWDEVFYYDIQVEEINEDGTAYKKTYTWLGGGLPQGTLKSAKFYAQTTWTLKKKHYNFSTGQYEWIEGIDLGWYYTGSSPYMEVTSDNGWYTNDSKYVAEGDQELITSYSQTSLPMVQGLKHKSLINSLYLVKEPQYNYIGYCKQVATIEYRKLLINKQLNIPEKSTTATVSLILDALLYYNIQLLTQINISNTTQADIYNENNGFPLSVKSININTSNCVATLELSINKTAQEQAKLQITSILTPVAPNPTTGFKNIIYKG